MVKQQDQVAILRILTKEMPYLRIRYGVDKLALFGSFARNLGTVDSDVDLMVSLSRPLGFAFIELADYLEQKLGRKVDLITSSTLEFEINESKHSHIAKDIQKSLIYVS